jgi:hypothetical protein
MSAKSVRIWGPAVLGAVSVVAVGYALNRLTGDDPKWWWWWIIVGAGSIVGILGTVWTAVSVVRERRSSPGIGLIEGGGAGDQKASGQATNISITADRGSAAALEMGDVSIGNPRRRRRTKRKTS